MNNIAKYIIEAYSQGYSAGVLSVDDGNNLYESLETILRIIEEAEKGTKHE